MYHGPHVAPKRIELGTGSAFYLTLLSSYSIPVKIMTYLFMIFAMYKIVRDCLDVRTMRYNCIFHTYYSRNIKYYHNLWLYVCTTECISIWLGHNGFINCTPTCSRSRNPCVSEKIMFWIYVHIIHTIYNSVYCMHYISALR